MQFESEILSICQAKSIVERVPIQELWSGYGEIQRVKLSGSTFESVIAKIISVPRNVSHPRGWNTSISNTRKIRSYEVESHWYENFSNQVNDYSRLPKFIGLSESENSKLILLEDLSVAGFTDVRGQLTSTQIKDVLQWLANFHAFNLGVLPNGLWETGTYWHFATRPDEFSKMESGRLKDLAATIDQKLNECRFNTLVHGDAKQANFMFTEGGRVAAVDFQYVGGGCGMKDVIYFLSSCMDDMQLRKYAEECLDYYFENLRLSLQLFNSNVDFRLLESEWRSLYVYAWADFARFLLGWSPDHYKLNSYVKSIISQL